MAHDESGPAIPSATSRPWLVVLRLPPRKCGFLGDSFALRRRQFRRTRLAALGPAQFAQRDCGGILPLIGIGVRRGLADAYIDDPLRQLIEVAGTLRMLAWAGRHGSSMASSYFLVNPISESTQYQ